MYVGENANVVDHKQELYKLCYSESCQIKMREPEIKTLVYCLQPIVV